MSAPSAPHDAALGRVTVLYDGRCSVCVRCRDWLARAEQHVPLELVDAHGADARGRFGAIPWLAQELVCVDAHGRAWAGPAAFLLVLFCLRRWRAVSRLLCTPLLLPIAAAFFAALSKHRGAFGWIVGASCEGGHCGAPAVVSPYR